MNDFEKNLNKAVDALKQEKIPDGPSEQLIQITSQKLEKISQQPLKMEDKNTISFSNAIKNLTKIAAAAVILLTAGYAVGRISAPKPPDVEEIRSEIEPAIRQTLLEELNQNVQASLIDGYVLIREDLTQQYQQDLDEMAVQIFSASGAVTNQRLEELIVSVSEAQTQDRQLFTTALEQIELNRIQDTETLSTAFVSFASQTYDRLQRTQNDIIEIAQIISYGQSDNFVPNEYETIENLN